jgi:outer membrane protein assembly factor BamB
LEVAHSEEGWWVEVLEDKNGEVVTRSEAGRVPLDVIGSSGGSLIVQYYYPEGGGKIVLWDFLSGKEKLIQTESQGPSATAVARDNVVFSLDAASRVEAYDLGLKRVRWRSKALGLPKGDISYGDALYCGRSVIVADVGGDLYFLDLRDGTTLYKQPLAFGTLSIEGDHIAIVSPCAGKDFTVQLIACHP